MTERYVNFAILGNTSFGGFVRADSDEEEAELIEYFTERGAKAWVWPPEEGL